MIQCAMKISDTLIYLTGEASNHSINKYGIDPARPEWSYFNQIMINSPKTGYRIAQFILFIKLCRIFLSCVYK